MIHTFVIKSFEFKVILKVLKISSLHYFIICGFFKYVMIVYYTQVYDVKGYRTPHWTNEFFLIIYFGVLIFFGLCMGCPLFIYIYIYEVLHCLIKVKMKDIIVLTSLTRINFVFFLILISY